MLSHRSLFKKFVAAADPVNKVEVEDLLPLLPTVPRGKKFCGRLIAKFFSHLPRSIEMITITLLFLTYAVYF
uniref:Ovule protein n=1 Tax=Heterorhabditis bacteriophora TaxID=37862 RepID=A0A1I7XC53_HETBA